MDIRHLRYFVAAAETLHFGRAAEQLGIAPPTLTVQIQEIERSLSAHLFTRTRRSVALTPAGEVFLVEARAVLARFAQAESVGRRAGRGEVGRLELGYVGSAVFAGVLQAQVNHFRSMWPGVEVHSRELPMVDVPKALADGTLDIGFVRLPMVLPSGISRHILVRDEFCVALPAAHPLAVSSSAVRPSALAGEAFVLPEQDEGTHEVGRRGRFVPRVVGAPGSLVAVLAQVSLGAGVSVLPSVLAATVRIPGVAFRSLLGEPIPSQVAAIFRTRDPTPAVRNLMQQIRKATPVRVQLPTPSSA